MANQIEIPKDTPDWQGILNDLEIVEVNTVNAKDTAVSARDTAVSARDSAIDARDRSETAADVQGVDYFVATESDLSGISSPSTDDTALVGEDSSGNTQAIYKYDGSNWVYTNNSLLNSGQVDSAYGVVGLDGNKQAQLDGGLDTRGDVVDNQNNIVYDYANQQVADGVLSANVPLTNDPSVPIGAKETAVLQDSTNLDDPHDLWIEGGLAHVVGKGGSYAIVDISNPNNPTVLGSVTTLNNPETVQVVGNYSFVGDDDGVHVYDVSNPSNVNQLSSNNSTQKVNGMAFWGSYLFCANKAGNVDVFDVDDPKNISFHGRYDAGGNAGINSPHDIDIFNGRYVIIPNQKQGATPKFAVVEAISSSLGEIKDTNNWDLEASITDSRLDGANRVIVRGTSCYVANNYDGSIAAIDLSDPQSITIDSYASLSDASTNAVNGITLAGDYLIACASGSAVYYFYDISDPANISKAGEASTPNGDPDHDLEVWGNIIVATDGGTDDSITIAELNGLRLPALDAGGVRTDTLHVADYAHMKDLVVTNSMYVNGEIVATSPLVSSLPVVFGAKSTSRDFEVLLDKDFANIKARATTGTDQKMLQFQTESGGGFSIRVDDLSVSNPSWRFTTFATEDMAFYPTGRIAARMTTDRRLVLREDVSDPGSGSNPVLQLGSDGAGFTVNTSGEIVAVDNAGNGTVIT